ncbi:hypothetical protein ARMGADRAFT_1079079 [Armillaria gallica]|uniref:Uncharacterized protein n=1 Tax=Armillaria gallica TaxID=47427 RepID=A0A2H3DJY0_ARMGA|nr:hypothetical protein ARMGADRAFT_1079079 [Armillaria gallica]
MSEMGDEDWLLDKEGDNPNTPAEEINENVKYDSNDLLGKILALVTQIHRSPQAKAYLSMLCKQEGLAPLELLKWVQT